MASGGKPFECVNQFGIVKINSRAGANLHRPVKMGFPQQKLIRKVTDTMTALEIHFSLDVLEETLSKTFDEIDRMVTSIMADLDELTKESTALLKKVQ